MVTSSVWLVPRRQAESAAKEALEHPDFRLICAFFLGWLSMASLYHVLYSVYVRDIGARGLRTLRWLSSRSARKSSGDPESAAAEDPPSEEKNVSWVNGDETSSIRRKYDHSALVFTLNVCILSAGLTDFASLLSFRGKAAWDIGCAFVVAWGGMTSDVAGLVCIAILSLQLRRNGAHRWEVHAVWMGMLVALALVFAANALSAGTTSFVNPLAVYVCKRGNNLPVSLAATLTQLFIALYLGVRLVVIQLPLTPKTKNIVSSVQTLDVYRAGSVIVLNLLTIVPNALNVNAPTQFIPFSIGGLLVLLTFNHSSCSKSAPALPTVSPIFNIPIPPPNPASVEVLYPQSSLRGGSVHDEEPVSPPGARPALRISLMSDRSFDSAIVDSVEEAIIATAVRHAAGRPALAVPHSAPPRMEAFSSRPFPRIEGPSLHPPGLKSGHILPSQVEFAERLERELVQRAPIGGPVLRPSDRDRKLRVVIYDDDSDESGETGAKTPGSLLGSDIIYRSPIQMHPSPAGESSKALNPRSSTFGMLAIEVPEHDSYVAAQDLLSEYYPDRRSFSIMSHRTNSIGSPRSTRRTTRHFSITSHRKRSMEELPIVPEQGNTGTSTTPTRSSMRRARRTTFGRPVSASSRRTVATHSESPVPPMPTRPTIYLSAPSMARPSLELPELSPLSISPLKNYKSLPSPLRSPLPAVPQEAASAAGMASTSASTLDQAGSVSAPPSAPRRVRPLPTAPIPANVGVSVSESSEPSPPSPPDA